MNLCVDIGNTNTVIGVFDSGKLIYRWRVATVRSNTQDDLKSYIYTLFHIDNFNYKKISKVFISSVVPTWNHSWNLFVIEFFNITPIFIKAGIKTGIKIRVDNPTEVGADRIVNSVAAIKHFKKGAIIIDSGTAITVDVISPDKVYMGGAIMPGISISIEALSSKTSKLGRVDVTTPEKALGKNTSDCIISGLYYGFSGMIDRVTEEIIKELNFNPEIIVTGGLGGKLANASKLKMSYIRDLTLEGLDLIAELN